MPRRKKISDTKFDNLPDRDVRKGVRTVEVDAHGHRFYRAAFKQLYITKDRTLALDVCGNVYELVPGDFGRVWMRVTDRVKDSVGVKPVEEDEDEEDEKPRRRSKFNDD